MADRFSIQIAASPERVWEAITDFERLPAWIGSKSEIRRFDEGVLSVGSKYIAKEPDGETTTFTCIGLDEPHSFTMVTGTFLMRRTVRRSVEQAGDGCRVSFEGQNSGPAYWVGWPLAFVLRGLARRLFEAEAAALKRVCEGE